YSEKAEDWRANMDRLTRKFDTAREIVPPPVIEGSGNNDLGIIAYGSSHAPVQEARDAARNHGIETDYLRLRALPVNATVGEFIEAHPVVVVVEQNRDGQV